MSAPIITATSRSGSHHIRSFVHRRAHITPSQQAALDRLLPQWSIPYQHTPLDPTGMPGDNFLGSRSLMPE